MEKKKKLENFKSDQKAHKEERLATDISRAKEAQSEQRTYKQLYRLIISIIRRNGFKLENGQTEEDVVHDIMLSFLQKKGDEEISLPPWTDEPPVIDLKMGYPESLRKLIWQRTYHHCIDIFRYDQRIVSMYIF